MSIVDYNTPEVLGPDDLRFAHADMHLAKLVATALHRAYPNRYWTIHADSQNRILDVMLADATTRYGYCIHLANKTLFEIEREAIFGGGEILERFNLSRNVIFDRDTVDALPRSITGDAIQA